MLTFDQTKTLADRLANKNNKKYYVVRCKCGRWEITDNLKGRKSYYETK